jgi:hypothetical protein
MSHKTVFVIGAGASSEVDLPVGLGLKGKIKNLLTFTGENIHGFPDDGDKAILRVFDQIDNGKQRPLLFAASEQISRAMTQAISIDNFIDARSDNESIVLCGKIAIVRAILQAEAESKLSGEKINFELIEKTWFTKFFRLLFENCRPENLGERIKSIVLIVFNYDRCIEHFLYHALQNYYDLSPEQTISLLKDLQIFHPYGTVGKLLWQDTDNTGSGIHFGKTPTASELIELSKQVKTFTEGTDESLSEINSIRSHIESSKRLVFLGFSFLKQNLDILAPISSTPVYAKWIRYIYGTGIGISIDCKEHIIRDLENRLGINATGQSKPVNINIYSERHTCDELFEDYKIGLSFVTKLEY